MYFGCLRCSTTPEALRSPTWRKLIPSPEMKERLCLLAVDEAHCVSQWGEDFRPEFRQIGELRSLTDVSLLVVTATEKVQQDIHQGRAARCPLEHIALRSEGAKN
ncbi:hypothetical protein DPMN_190713 [Dreissena polymorpha]|uniref:Helicase ATP-binding domain-containing protein n=1 Tax=Dreissena polymorpha TaxID=45954 RepID=A0A9D3Y1V9_DREPO|nr:hypothetical protein DPMN_190713 [Dreissena polymorpha]